MISSVMMNSLHPVISLLVGNTILNVQQQHRCVFLFFFSCLHFWCIDKSIKCNLYIVHCIFMNRKMHQVFSSSSSMFYRLLKINTLHDTGFTSFTLSTDVFKTECTRIIACTLPTSSRCIVQKNIFIISFSSTRFLNSYPVITAGGFLMHLCLGVVKCS